GRVTRVDVATGERVRVGDGLLELFDISKLEVRAQIPERHLPAVRGGAGGDDAVGASLALEGRDYPMRLVRLAAAIRDGQGGLDGFFQFVGDPAPRLEVGRVSTLHLHLPPVPDAVSLPVGALYGADIVYRVVDGRLESTPVVYAGEHEADDGDTRAIVRSEALAVGDVVMVTQIPAAVDGLKVTIANP
ncbi:MAG: HlyD family efflux transporter periplasmic adaptor subunit, partial [Proteobacteria bacterium]